MLSNSPPISLALFSHTLIISSYRASLSLRLHSCTMKNSTQHSILSQEEEPTNTVSLMVHPEGSVEPQAKVPRTSHSVATLRDGNKHETVLPESTRERLKRHRIEMAGRVSVPDSWGQEKLLKEWIDYSSFDALLAPSGIAMARKALVAERRARSRGLRVEGRC